MDVRLVNSSKKRMWSDLEEGYLAYPKALDQVYGL